ncbi:MAG: (5-formylfuran-3-yl)methyl phosphate synthase [Hyphomicrobiaceae bacterium]|nr:(5-formylfuran-3-yl)methyl phosphate synthase [Hyphomicrobiaceae bacterium]
MGNPRHIRFLASVRNEDEARLALAEGADIIDCKEPASGALGALPLEVVAAVRRAIPAQIPVSATVGDLPCEAAALCGAAQTMAGTGVDYVKVGLFPGTEAKAAIAELGRLDLGRSRLVAVMFADLEPDFSLIANMTAAGFAGVLLDTAGKSSGAIVEHMTHGQMAQFVAMVRANALFAGLAGSLRLEHIAPLRMLAPDILGFRGALCTGSQRQGALDVISTRAVARALKGRAETQQFAGPEALAS